MEKTQRRPSAEMQSSRSPGIDRPTFYTVAETAQLLRVDTATIYRAIRANAFPAIRVRSRYVIPAAAFEGMAVQATETGACIDVAAIAAGRRVAREVARIIGGRS